MYTHAHKHILFFKGLIVVCQHLANYNCQIRSHFEVVWVRTSFEFEWHNSTNTRYSVKNILPFWHSAASQSLLLGQPLSTGYWMSSRVFYSFTIFACMPILPFQCSTLCALVSISLFLLKNISVDFSCQSIQILFILLRGHIVLCVDLSGSLLTDI